MSPFHPAIPLIACTTALQGTNCPLAPKMKWTLPAPYLHSVSTQHWPNAGRNRVDVGDIRWVDGREPLEPR